MSVSLDIHEHNARSRGPCQEGSRTKTVRTGCQLSKNPPSLIATNLVEKKSQLLLDNLTAVLRAGTSDLVVPMSIGEISPKHSTGIRDRLEA